METPPPLPHELITLIMSYLSLPRDVASASLVSRLWAVGASKDLAWRKVVRDLLLSPTTREPNQFSFPSNPSINVGQRLTESGAGVSGEAAYLVRGGTSESGDRRAAIDLECGGYVFEWGGQPLVVRREKTVPPVCYRSEHENRGKQGRINVQWKRSVHSQSCRISKGAVPYRQLAKRKAGDKLLPVDCKVVLMGNVDVGKSSLLRRFVSGSFVEDCPEVFQSDTQLVYHGSEVVLLHLWDTEMWDTSFSIHDVLDGHGDSLDSSQKLPPLLFGGEDYSAFRSVTYANTDVFLYCFALDNPESLEYVETRWAPEVYRHAPGTPHCAVLCGLKSDKAAKVSQKQAVDVARKIRASAYVECSARTGENIAMVFMACIDCAMECLTFEELDAWALTEAAQGKSTCRYKYKSDVTSRHGGPTVEKGFSLGMKYKYFRARDDQGRYFQKPTYASEWKTWQLRVAYGAPFVYTPRHGTFFSHDFADALANADRME